MKTTSHAGGRLLPFFLGMAAACGQAAAQAPAAAPPQTPRQTSSEGWQGGAVLDAAASSRELALGQRDKGLGLGHSDLTAHGPLGPHVQAQITAAAHTHDRKLELELEEAWFQTRTLPLGLQFRAGRFASQVGYLNEQHPHADDFVQRPLLYRAFLGGHWTDDGLRLNWTAPTDLYLRLGVEVFRGKRLVEEAASARRPGVAVFSAKTGGDLGTSHSWQAGLSYLHNRREAVVEEEEEHGPEEESAGHEVGHAEGHGAHGAAFSGRRMWVGELAWKWAPQGNNNEQQVRVAYEYAQVRRLNRFAASGDRHHAHYLSAVWRFRQGWEVGARHDVLRVRMPHGDHFDDGRLRESALMLAWKPSHAQTLRLQFTRQRDRGGFDDATNAVQLQYILNFGAHAAHSF
ncbi:MAG TPA: hypothetical protein VHM00_09990 [Caldimonas sp.]|jgi:hypothetical protein|nr:hypothetical protein [Caldimonas sp.]HEX2541399.1 hypothetical protein [Caldimonas sp.]